MGLAHNLKHQCDSYFLNVKVEAVLQHVLVQALDSLH